MVIIAILLGEIMKNRFLLLVNKLWQKQQLFIPKMNHFLNHFKPFENAREHCRMSFRAPAIAGVIISTVTALSVAALSVTSNPLPKISYKTSWIRNTFGGGSRWVPIQIAAMYVGNEATVYTNSVWDEAGRETGIYKNPDAIGKASNLHGWGRIGGEAVTANSKYLYIAMTQGAIDRMVLQDYPPSKRNWYCVRRYNLSG
jgi:hypothetical protein